jgi:hypothetical protein
MDEYESYYDYGADYNAYTDDYGDMTTQDYTQPSSEPEPTYVVISLNSVYDALQSQLEEMSDLTGTSPDECLYVLVDNNWNHEKALLSLVDSFPEAIRSAHTVGWALGASLLGALQSQGMDAVLAAHQQPRDDQHTVPTRSSLSEYRAYLSSALAGGPLHEGPCGVCWDAQPLLLAPCGHGFCADCWDGHIRERAAGLGLDWRCMHPGCDCPLPLALVDAVHDHHAATRAHDDPAPCLRHLCRSKLALLYASAAPFLSVCSRADCAGVFAKRDRVKHVLDSNSNGNSHQHAFGASLCAQHPLPAAEALPAPLASPAADPSAAPILASRQAQLPASPLAACRCGTALCVGCGSARDHRPASCAEAQRWAARSGEQRDTSEWLMTHTRKCECGVRIEKNHGCNHVTCARCHKEICWVCGGDWAEHLKAKDRLSAYRCVRYTPKHGGAAAGGEEDEAERYMFYLSRVSGADWDSQQLEQLQHSIAARAARGEQQGVRGAGARAGAALLEDARQVALWAKACVRWGYVKLFAAGGGGAWPQAALFEFAVSELGDRVEAVCASLFREGAAAGDGAAGEAERERLRADVSLCADACVSFIKAYSDA